LGQKRAEKEAPFSRRELLPCFSEKFLF
jgi:hypothetical protein